MNMANNAMAVAVGIVGLGFISIGFQVGDGTTVAHAGNIETFNRGIDPNIVWFGVTSEQGGGLSNPDRHIVYHRMWSDGKIEMRYAGTTTGCQINTEYCDWVVVPSAPNGAVACRSDLNGDQQVGVEDLLIVVDDWGNDAQCAPSFGCLDLGNVGGPPAM